MIKLTITFKSPFMEEDKLRLTAETIELAKQQYFGWWKAYGKDEQYAIDAVIETDVKEEK